MNFASILSQLRPVKGRWWAQVGLLVVVVLHLAQALPFQDLLRTASFDLYQLAAPRERTSAPVTIVDIDERSLAKFGQWPWPRSLVARLIDALWESEPAVVALDILMPEPDRTSACEVLRHMPRADPDLMRTTCRLPSNDQLLAAALSRGPAVLGVAGVDGESSARPRAPPLRVIGDDPLLAMRHFRGALANLPVLDAAASGHAILSTDIQYGGVRRVPMVASVGSVILPSLTIEALRLVTGGGSLMIESRSGRIRSVGIQGLMIPTDGDGSLWVHYSHHDPDRFVSAEQVLERRADKEALRDKVILIGMTGLGLIDFHATALGERIPGVEIHAQVLETLFDGTQLRRPEWARWAEAGAMLCVGLFVIWGFPRLKARILVPIMLAATVCLAIGGFVAFLAGHLLLDVASPISMFIAISGFMLADLHIRDEAHRKVLESDLQSQREQAARAKGEMEAARRIQMGILPDLSRSFASETRLDVAACMIPARLVGGDLYDCFMLDEHRVYLALGDVCGKGVPASLFMVIAKTLCKSLALRSDMANASPGELMRRANTEISRDNPEMLFVTALIGILDLRTGLLSYCNAGHECPLLVTPEGAPTELPGAGGPPLCILENYEYQTQSHTLAPGELLCLITDGVTEAFNADQVAYGKDRLLEVLRRPANLASAGGLLQAVSDDVELFCASAEASDDFTALVLRWTPDRRNEPSNPETGKSAALL